MAQPVNVNSLYDRQVRLWGHESQNKLIKSKPFIIGNNLVAEDVIKNLLLSGVRNILIFNETNKEVNFKGIFFCNNNLHNLKEKFLDFNPLASPTVVKLCGISQEDWSSITSVCITDILIENIQEICLKCAECSIPIFISSVYGHYGYFKLFENITTKFKSIESVIGAQLHVNSPEVLNILQFLFYCHKITFQQKKLLKSIDINEFNYEDLGLDLRTLTEEFPPTQFITGAVLSQELIKILSGSEKSPCNLFIFDGVKSSGWYIEN